MTKKQFINKFFPSCLSYDKEDQDKAFAMFEERFPEALSRSQSRTITIDKDAFSKRKYKEFKKQHNKSWMEDSIGSRLINMKLSEAIDFFKALMEDHGDCTIIKQPYVNMGLTIATVRKETDKEKEERVIEELVGDITRKIHDYQQKEYEKESLRERLRKLESN